MALTSTTVIVASLAVLLLSFQNLRRLLQGWKFLLKGRATMLDHARKASLVRSNPHQAFSLPIPGNRLHVMCSKGHWNDLNNAGGSHLSPNAASREMFQPKYTFGYDWSVPREQISLATVRSIRNMTLRLPSLQTKFVAILDQEFDRALAVNAQTDGWARVPMWFTLRRAVTRINTLVLFGEDIANNDDFTTSGLKFVDQSSLIIEAVRLLPAFMGPIVTKLIRGRSLDRKYVFDVVEELVAKRESSNRSAPDRSKIASATFLEGVVDYCQDNRSTQQNVESIITTWVISTLAIPIVACQLLQDVYTQSDHFSALREESQSIALQSSTSSQEIYDGVGRMQMLEAFAMESWRTKCFQANTVHRIAVRPFEFSDGYQVQVGEAVEFHQHGLMTDDSLFPDHTKFGPTRFLNKNKSLVDTGLDWPFWGVSKHMCPGRWHVANLEKLLAVYVMQKFEAKLEGKVPLNFEWRDALVPNPKICLLMKRRSVR